MATKMLESSAIAAFCESAAVMHSAGIQMDEAVYLLGENMQDAAFKNACDSVYAELISGKSLAEALEKSESFPHHVVDMVAAGEHSGRLENVLWSLAKYYDEEDRLYAKTKSAVAYPAALLSVMTVILLFTVAVILPVFVDVYTGLTGNLTSGSFAYVNASIIIGWTALGITLLCTVLVLVGIVASRSPQGRSKLVRLLERMPLTRRPLRQMAVRAVRPHSPRSSQPAPTPLWSAPLPWSTIRLEPQIPARAVRGQMTDPSLGKAAQAVFDNNVFEPVYARMLVVGTLKGSLETVLASLSDTFFDDSSIRLDRLIDSVEPTLAAFLTVSVGATLIAVMLPLIGIMGSIG